MKKIITQFVIVFLMIFAAGWFIARPCQAASAEIEISADTTEVTVGDSVFVYIKIKSGTPFTNFEAYLAYDDNIMKYKSGASVITGGNGLLKISDMDVTDGDTSRKYTIELKALKVGLCSLSFNGNYKVYDSEGNGEMSVSSNDLTLSVKAPETASTNAKLKSFRISPSELSPAFDPDTFEYNTTVRYDTDQLIISAIPEDVRSTVSITGNENLKEGENKVIVSVLAESGNIIEYTINVKREQAPGQENTQPKTTPAPSQVTFELINSDGSIYAVYSGKYEILEADNSVAIPEGYQEGTMELSDIPITVFVPTDNKESQFVLLYARNEQGDVGFYQYDRIEKTLQRYVQNSMGIGGSMTEAEKEKALLKKYNNNLNKAAIVIALLAGICGLMIFISIRLYLKLKGRKNDDLE